MIGKTLGQYKIHERIGAGGMGEVYRATDTRLGRDVALKFLPQDLASNAERLSRFEREARLLASLNHPNVAVVHGLESFDDLHVLVMELIDGEDLSQRVARGALSQEEALEIMRQVAEGLGAAHHSGIFHRDLKPANIKVTSDGVAKVLDFGLAKSDPVASGSVDLSMSPTITHAATQSGVILGTAAYMSPEQARGKPVDRRADIFAFGAVLFELLSGHRVFAGETVSDTLAAILRADPDWHLLPKSTAPRVVQLLERCLEKAPRQRLQDIGEARIAIERVQAGDIGIAEDQAAPPRTGRVRWAWAFLAVFAAGILLGRLFPNGGDVEPDAPLVRSEFAVKDPLYKNMTFSPDGRRLLYVDTGQLWIRDLDQFEAQPVPGSEGAQIAAWSPDGSQLVLSEGPRLYRMAASGGTRVKLATIPDAMHSFAGGLAWTQDDRILFVTGSSALYWIPATGGDPRIAMQIPEGVEDFHHLDLLPDGSSVLYSIHEPGRFQKIGVSRDGVGKTVFEDEHNVGFPVYSPTGHLVYLRQDEGLWAVGFSLEKMQATGQPFLVAADGAQADVSPNGTLAYMTSQENVRTQLLWFDLSGTALDTLQITPRRQDSFMSLSPDTRYLVTSEWEEENQDIWIYDLQHPGTQRRLTSDTARDGYPVFTRDGSSILYSHGLGLSEVEIRQCSIDGRGSPRTLAAGLRPSLSPDGEWVVFEHLGKSFQLSLFFMPLDGSSEPKLLYRHEATSVSAPQFSPDGKYVLFQNADSNNLHLISFPDAQNQWQVTTEGGQSPRWNSGTSDVFYINDDQVMRIRIETDPEVSIGMPQRVVQREAITPRDSFVLPSAQGDRVLVQRAVDPHNSQPRIRLVQNWFRGATP